MKRIKETKISTPRIDHGQPIIVRDYRLGGESLSGPMSPRDDKAATLVGSLRSLQGFLVLVNPCSSISSYTKSIIAWHT